MNIGPKVHRCIFYTFTVFFSYMFPRQMLCRHFWTDEQKSTFGLYYLKPRLQHYPKMQSFLYKESFNITDVRMREKFQKLLSKVSVSLGCCLYVISWGFSQNLSESRGVRFRYHSLARGIKGF